MVFAREERTGYLSRSARLGGRLKEDRSGTVRHNSELRPPAQEEAELELRRWYSGRRGLSGRGQTADPCSGQPATEVGAELSPQVRGKAAE